jgi:hypothetical protein
VPDHSTALAAIESSNMPHTVKKSLIRTWYDKVTGGVTSLDRLGGHVREGGHVVRQGGEAAFVGVALGLIDAERGGLDIGKVPIDGILAVAGFGASISMAHDPYGICADMRNIGSDALTVLCYRKTKAWREASKGKTGTTHGESEDPIAIAASDL